MAMRRIMMLSLIAIFSSSVSLADTIIFKSGMRLDVDEVWEDGGQIKCEMYGAVVAYPKESIQKIERKRNNDLESNNRESEAETDMPPESEVSQLSKGPPLVTKSENWKYIVNAACQVADDYAMWRKPASTFICQNRDARLVKQLEGPYKGQYLLMLTCPQGRDVSFAVLYPNFDVNKPAETYNHRGFDLWKVVKAKFNGVEY